MFRIKICGVTRVDDALMVAEAGADAVGLNFYPASRRYLPRQAAEAIVAALPSHVTKVGLFVNAPAAEVAEICDRLHLDIIQLHGDEPPEYLAQLPGRPVMKAFRLGPEGLEPVAAYLHQCREAGCVPALCLVDSFKPGHYGGTGQVADWTKLETYPFNEWHPPLVLAGGLTPENVGRAIEQAGPLAVDTSSGVESSPGQKDPVLVQRFVAAAKAAFAKLYTR
jgi:phosphoribosylanthranilate isomerase